MNKRELLERIERLERRVRALEAGEFKYYPPVVAPDLQRCTCVSSGVSSTACPVHGLTRATTTEPIYSVVSA